MTELFREGATVRQTLIIDKHTEEIYHVTVNTASLTSNEVHVAKNDSKMLYKADTHTSTLAPQPTALAAEIRPSVHL